MNKRSLAILDGEKAIISQGYWIAFGGEDLGFSHRCCDLCDSLPGDRYSSHTMCDGEIVDDLEVCVDCIMYIANGELPED